MTPGPLPGLKDRRSVAESKAFQRRRLLVPPKPCLRSEARQLSISIAMGRIDVVTSRGHAAPMIRLAANKPTEARTAMVGPSCGVGKSG